YNFYEGVLSPVMLPQMANAVTFANMMRENQSYRNVDESNMMFSLEDIDKFKSGEYPWTHPSTDWYDEALKDYTTTRNHNLSFSGGSEFLTYHTSFGYHFDDGIFTNNASS